MSKQHTVKLPPPAFKDLKRLQRFLKDGAFPLALGNLVGYLARQEIKRQIADGTWQDGAES